MEDSSLILTKVSGILKFDLKSLALLAGRSTQTLTVIILLKDSNVILPRNSTYTINFIIPANNDKV